MALSDRLQWGEGTAVTRGLQKRRTHLVSLQVRAVVVTQSVGRLDPFVRLVLTTMKGCATARTSETQDEAPRAHLQLLMVDTRDLSVRVPSV